MLDKLSRILDLETWSKDGLLIEDWEEAQNLLVLEEIKVIKERGYVFKKVTSSKFTGNNYEPNFSTQYYSGDELLGTVNPNLLTACEDENTAAIIAHLFKPTQAWKCNSKSWREKIAAVCEQYKKSHNW